MPGRELLGLQVTPVGVGWFWRRGWEGDGDRFGPRDRGCRRPSLSGREEAELLGCVGCCDFWHLAGTGDGEHPSPGPIGDTAAKDRVVR